MKFARWNGTLIGEKPAFTIWFVIGKIGVFLVKEHGEYQFQYFTVKMEQPSLLKRPLNMFRIYFGSMVLTFGLNGRQKLYYQTALLPSIALMGSLQKKQI